MASLDDLVASACRAFGVKIVAELKHGGQKHVLQVTDGDQDFVLKVVSIGSAMPESLRRAQREVELLKAIDSPHVVKVASDLVELGDPADGACWLEELLDGEDLAELLGDPWDWSEVARMGIETAQGLASLHDRHVVHRDLSPNNVRRRSSGSYVVLDPGFARHELRSGLTVAGQPGTRGYMSPEHVRGYSCKPTSFSDVFGVGILLYQAVTGSLPIPYRGDDADYARRVGAVALEGLEDLAAASGSEDRANLIKRCLHPQPARRFASGRDLAEALEAIE